MVKPGYKQTEIGVIPEDWEIKYLSDFGKIQSGGTPSTTMAEYWGGNIAWCTPSDITSTPTKYINVTERTITEAGLNNSAATVMPAGSILLCTRATIGELKINSIPMATNQGFKNITVNNSGNAEFLYYLLQTKKSRMLDLAIGSTFLEISKTALSKILLQIPMRDEQNKIADALSDMDNLVVVLEKQIAKKKAIKQGAMQELLTGKRRLPGFSGEWETKKLEDYCSLITKQTGFDYSAYIKPALITRKMPNTFPMIQTINFRGRKFTFETDYYIPQSVAMQFPNIVLNKKCVLFSIVGASVGNVGLYPGSITAFCGGAIGITRFHNEQDAEWVFNYMSSPDGQSQIQYVTKGGAQATVTIADIRNFKIPTPEKGERDAISGILENMDHEIEALEQKLEKYRQVKQGMMQQLLTGKIRLKNDVEDLRQAEQANAVKTLPARTAHNRQFDDAVSIAAIVDTFYSDKYPLGRVKVQKLLYLLHRHQAASVSDFKKKAAGPYADTVRYKGGEPIAKKNKYIVSESGKQGTRYSKGTNMGQALDYVERWGMQADLQWLKENFLHTSRNDLELFATVDMAMCDLDKVGISVSVESIKNLIASNNEWKAKLSKTYFSDWDIARAIKKCTELFN